MGMACTVCNHEKRVEIDRSIISGQSHTKIAKEYGLNSQAIRHHAAEHLTRQLVTAMEKKEALESHNLISKIDDILAKAKLIFERNYARKKDAIALKALDSQRNTLELLSKIAFALHQARANELEMERIRNQEKEDTDVKNCLSEFMGRLNDDEQQLFTLLVSKASGEIDEIVLPEKFTFSEFKLEPQKEPKEEVIEETQEIIEQPPEPHLRVVTPVPPREIPSGKKVRLARHVLNKRLDSKFSEEVHTTGNSGGMWIPESE